MYTVTTVWYNADRINVWTVKGEKQELFEVYTSIVPQIANEIWDGYKKYIVTDVIHHIKGNSSEIEVCVRRIR